MQRRQGRRGLVAGLTGGIATGKSTVARMLAELGAVIVSADEIARDVVAPGEPAAEDIRTAFGGEVFLEDGTLNRRALGAIVFGDESARHRLEAITHPHIRIAMRQRIDEAADAGEFVVAEIPLLFESEPARAMVDVAIVVHTAEDVQLERLMARDGLTEEAARARISAQLPLADKVAAADYVIDNVGTEEQTRTQVEHLWSKLQRRTTGET